MLPFKGVRSLLGTSQQSLLGQTKCHTGIALQTNETWAVCSDWRARSSWAAVMTSLGWKSCSSVVTGIAGGGHSAFEVTDYGHLHRFSGGRLPDWQPVSRPSFPGSDGRRRSRPTFLFLYLWLFLRKQLGFSGPIC